MQKLRELGSPVPPLIATPHRLDYNNKGTSRAMWRSTASVARSSASGSMGGSSIIGRVGCQLREPSTPCFLPLAAQALLQ